MSDLLSVFRTRWCSATITRAQFLSAGVGLFLLKYAIDLMIARAAFHRGWSPWDYLVTSVPLTALSNLSQDAAFHLTLLGVAIPFILLGVALTLARLRTVGLPAWMVVLFFLPVLNLLFFLMLAVAPAAQKNPPAPAEPEREPAARAQAAQAQAVALSETPPAPFA